METLNPNIEGQQSVDLLQHLETLDLSTVDRSFPVLKEGAYVMTIRKFEPKQNKAKTGHNLMVTLELGQTAQTTEGKTINAGFPLTDTISLVQTEKYNPAEKLADIQLACTGKQQKGFKFADYVDRKITVRLSIEDNAEFGPRNRIRYVKLSGTPVASL